MVFDLVTGEKRRLVLIQLELVDVVRGHLLHELLHALVDIRIVDQDFADIGAQVVADGPHHQIAFLVDQEGRAALGRRLADGVPEMNEIVEVPLQLLRTLADAGGARDQRIVVRDLELGHGLAQLGAFFALDAARDATAFGVVGHEHQVPAREADKGGQGRALAAALLLVHLNDQFLAFFDRVLDADLADGGAVPVGGEIDAGDLLERQKTLAFRPVVDERGFQAGFYAGDLSFVNIPFLVLVGLRLNIQVK